MTESEKRRLEKIQEQISQMKVKEKAIISRDKERERKARTRRLIQIGAIAEKYFDCAGIEPDEFEKKVKKIINKPGGING